VVVSKKPYVKEEIVIRKKSGLDLVLQPISSLMAKPFL
jgi:hypothetical protein